MEELEYRIKVTSGFEKLYMGFLKQEFSSFMGIEYVDVSNEWLDGTILIRMLAHPDYVESIKSLAAEKFDGKFA